MYSAFCWLCCYVVDCNFILFFYKGCCLLKLVFNDLCCQLCRPGYLHFGIRYLHPRHRVLHYTEIDPFILLIFVVSRMPIDLTLWQDKVFLVDWNLLLVNYWLLPFCSLPFFLHPALLTILCCHCILAYGWSSLLTCRDLGLGPKSPSCLLCRFYCCVFYQLDCTRVSSTSLPS